MISSSLLVAETTNRSVVYALRRKKQKEFAEREVSGECGTGEIGRGCRYLRLVSCMRPSKHDTSVLEPRTHYT